MTEDELTPAARARRQKILDAAIEVIATKGFAAISHRSVTEQAGISISSIGHFFPSIHDLADAAFTKMAHDHIDLHANLVAYMNSENAPTEDMISVLAQSAQESRGHVLMVVESYLRGARNPPSQSLIADFVAASESVAASAAELADVPDATRYAPAIYALILGLAMRNEVVPGTLSSEYSADVLNTLRVGALYRAGQFDEAEQLRRTLEKSHDSEL